MACGGVLMVAVTTQQSGSNQHHQLPPDTPPPPSALVSLCGFLCFSPSCPHPIPFPAAAVYELFTGKIAFQGWQWGAILEHVALHGKRPDMPEAAPEDFCVLVEACWHQDPSRRPSFEEVRQVVRLCVCA